MINETALKRITVVSLVVFYAAVLFFSVNIPQQDDFDSILAYLINSDSSLSAGLFDMHVSHRIILTRLLARLSSVVSGDVDFRLLSYFGSLSLLGVVAILYQSTKNIPQRALVLCLVCLCIFSFFHWSNVAWATASVQNYTITFVAVAVFWLFNNQGRYAVFGAIFLGLAAPYISSSGLLLLPILFVWAVVSPAASRPSGLQILTLVCATLISFYFFFLGFEEQFSNQSLPSAAIPDGLDAALNIIRAYLISSAGYLHFHPLALLGGLFINLYFLLLIKCRYYEQNKIVFYSYLFLLSSFVLVALFRSDTGISQLIASRYQIYTLLLNALVVISFFELGFSRYFPIKYFNQIVLALFSMLYASSFFYMGNLNSEKEKIVQGIVSFGDGDATKLYYPDTEHAGRILEQAVLAGIYKLPKQK
ncbi:MAG: hypothetical protein JKY29_01030 [Gammaproteobacteria bacterium]|nr:hypothetical protein [Gammaproteobacteria bacterium]